MDRFPLQHFGLQDAAEFYAQQPVDQMWHTKNQLDVLATLGVLLAVSVPDAAGNWVNCYRLATDKDNQRTAALQRLAAQLSQA